MLLYSKEALELYENSMRKVFEGMRHTQRIDHYNKIKREGFSDPNIGYHVINARNKRTEKLIREMYAPEPISTGAAVEQAEAVEEEEIVTKKKNKRATKSNIATGAKNLSIPTGGGGSSVGSI